MIKAKEGKENYVVGGEESFGLMIGNQIRDKDSVSAVALICEMVAYEKSKGRSIFDKLIDLYCKKRDGWRQRNCQNDGRLPEKPT